MSALILRIAIVNRFAPPDAAPTGQAAARLALLLRQSLPEAQITLVASRATYRRAPGARVPDGLRIVRVPSFYDGRHPLGRGLAWLWESLALARRAVQEGDLIIALTDPPLLPLVLDPLVRRAGGRWVQWCMDLYPESLAATGYLSPQSWLYRRLWAADAQLRPALSFCLGPGQAARLAERRPGLPVHLLPAGFPLALPEWFPTARDPWRSQDSASIAGGPSPPLTLIYAGNLGAVHDPAGLAALIEAAPPDRFRFVLAVHGSGAPILRQRLGTQPHILWRDHLSLEALAAAEIHLVSLVTPAGACCVPAKAITAISLGRPILFLGPETADVWALAGGAGWRIGEGDPDGRRAALETMADPEQRREKAATAARAATRLQAMERGAVEMLENVLRKEWKRGKGPPANPDPALDSPGPGQP